MAKLRTFKTKKLLIPDNFAQVELSIKGFEKLADKLDFSPVFDDGYSLSYIETDHCVFYFAKKESQNETL